MSRTGATGFGRVAACAVALSTAMAVYGLEAARAADAAPPLRVGIAPNYPPLAFKQDGQLKGIEVDFANRLGPALGRQVELVETPWDDLLKALTEDKTIDVVMSGVSITNKRMEKVDFAEPYLRVGQMVLIRDADYPHLRNAKALNKPSVRVGVTSNSTSEHYAKKHLEHAKLEGFADTDAGVAALRANQIDAFIVDAPAVWRVTGGVLSKETQLRGLYTPLTHEELAWAVRKDDRALLKQLDAVLAKWKKNGTIEDVLDHWIRVKKTTIEVKPQAQ
jgi:ABC-type amino acid transport substrate-binding protein